MLIQITIGEIIIMGLLITIVVMLAAHIARRKN